MKKTFLITMAFILLFSSCEDGFLGAGKKLASEYMPLEIGNYWIYETQHEQIDGSTLNTFDTLRIDKDTIVGEDTYAILEGTKFGLTFKALLRHDKENLVNEDGTILLDCEVTGHNTMDTTVIFDGDTIYSAYYRTGLLADPMKIETPAGDFDDVLVHSGYFSVNNSSYNDPVLLPSYYAKGVGIVEDNSFWLSSGLKSKMVLKEYIVN